VFVCVYSEKDSCYIKNISVCVEREMKEE
jgi:hypothetical protein